MIILDISICIIIFMLGLHLKDFFSALSKYDLKLLTKIYFYHILIAVVFYFYIQTRGDAVYYWMHPKQITFSECWNNLFTQSYASDYVYFLNFFWSNTLDLSFFTGSLIYAVFGFWGFLYFYLTLIKVVGDLDILRQIKVFGIRLFPLVLFFPNLHFWSSGVGKDTILFFAIGLFLYSSFNIKKHFFGLVVSFLLSFFIRPHITFFLIGGLGAGYILRGNLRSYQKVFSFVLFTGIFSFLFDKVLTFIKLDSFSVESVTNYATYKSSVLVTEANSGVDISGYPFPLKVLTYLYRPFFFDINNPLAIVASFENLGLLILTIMILKNKPKLLYKESSGFIMGAVFYLIIGTISFSLILGNLGIMLREKNMFTPVFFIVAFWHFYQFSIRKKQTLI